MARGKGPDWLLVIPAVCLLVGTALPYAALVSAPAPESDGFFGFGGLYILLGALIVAAPLFGLGFVWLLAALAQRRPLRDVVGWAIRVSVGLLSAAMLLVVGGAALTDFLHAGPSPLFWPAAAVAGFGAVGLLVVVLSLVPHRHRDATEAPEP